MPTRTDGTVVVSGSAQVSTGLPDTTTARAVRDASGTVVFADDRAPTDHAVQPTAGGVRSLLVIPG